MPRAGWVKPASDERLSDHISIGVLTRTFPPEVVDRVVAEAGKVQRRYRLLPARVVVYYVLALAMFSQSSYEEVMRQLVDGLAWSSGWRQAWNVPTKAALFKARARLGPEPLANLFTTVASPLAGSATKGAWYRSWRLMSIDGTCLDVADTPANEQAFGRHRSGRGEAAFPQVRLVGLAECGTHAVIQVAIGPCTTGEQNLAPAVFPALKAGMLCLADRGFDGLPLWRQAQQGGADLLWRARLDRQFPLEQRLSDGSYLAEVYASTDRRRTEGAVVRVIDYTVNDPGRPQAAPRYRLLTTILDPQAAPAAELAAIYAERWEFETVLDELKTHQRSPRVVLRSKLPEGVVQEIYGYLCVHYAIRWLMHQVALDADDDPDRLSFTRSLRVARRTTASHPGFSPSRTGRSAPPRSDRNPR